MEEAVRSQEANIEGVPKKKISKFRIIMTALCFVALFALFAHPSRHIFGINEDPYIAEIQTNISNLQQSLPQPLTYLWNAFFKNTFQKYLDGFKNYTPGQVLLTPNTPETNPAPASATTEDAQTQNFRFQMQ